eukprot:1158973-Pelagomonas_calceolata.AAC.24
MHVMSSPFVHAHMPLQDIKAGEELTFDYNFERYGDRPMRCYCQSKTCRKFVGGTQDSYDESMLARECASVLHPVLTESHVRTGTVRSLFAILHKFQRFAANRHAWGPAKPVSSGKHLHPTCFLQKQFLTTPTARVLYHPVHSDDVTDDLKLSCTADLDKQLSRNAHTHPVRVCFMLTGRPRRCDQ